MRLRWRQGSTGVHYAEDSWQAACHSRSGCGPPHRARLMSCDRNVCSTASRHEFEMTMLLLVTFISDFVLNFDILALSSYQRVPSRTHLDSEEYCSGKPLQDPSLRLKRCNAATNSQPQRASPICVAIPLGVRCGTSCGPRYGSATTAHWFCVYRPRCESY